LYNLFEMIFEHFYGQAHEDPKASIHLLATMKLDQLDTS